MDEETRNKFAWTMAFILEFSKRHGLTLRQGFNYLKVWRGIDFIDRCYQYVHTQSFPSMVDDVTAYCHRQGGALG